ncbi:MAG: nucleoside monophosphate kinase [Patescibacteria group bacterium]
MKLVLTGIQGSGKSTQGNLLSKQLKIPYLSTGHIFREIAKEKTKLGHYVKVVINSGMLIPDEKTIEIVSEYLSRPEYKRGYILDGFPRTLAQAKHFEKEVDKVICLDLPDKETLWRLSYRKDDRDDETLEALRKRIEIFHKHTKPVIEFFEKQDKVVNIDGTQSIKDVNEEILKNLGKQIIKNHVQEWEQKQRAIIAITGLSGSGKDEASQFFEEKKLPVIHFGNTINHYVDEKHLDQNEEIHNKLRLELREKHGKEAMAVLNSEKIAKALEDNMIVVINGVYSWEEYIYLKKNFPNVQIYLLAIFADKRIRYSRAAKREYRSKVSGEERDIHELTMINKGPTIAFADFLVKNNFSKEEFYDKLEEVYREVYFS